MHIPYFTCLLILVLLSAFTDDDVCAQKFITTDQFPISDNMLGTDVTRMEEPLKKVQSFRPTTSLATGRYMDAFILNNNNSAELFFEISNNTLTLYRGIIAADGTIETYERIGN